MFKKVLAVLVSATTCWGSLALAVCADPGQDTMSSSDILRPKGDPGDDLIPWPWSLTQPFPWTSVHGMWRTNSRDFDYLYSLKVVNEKSTGERYVRVQQIDVTTCEVVAEGVGYQNRKVLRGVMNGRAGNYRFALRAFRIKDSPAPPVGRIVGDYVMVMSLIALDSTVTKTVHVQIGKISDRLSSSSCSLAMNE
ncbi:MAG: hypothetical protein ACOYOK_10115 [Pseudobdellovibrionaceae bacterium]